MAGPFRVSAAAHALSKRQRKHLANYRFLVGPGVRELLQVVGVESGSARSGRQAPCGARAADRDPARSAPEVFKREACRPAG